MRNRVIGQTGRITVSDDSVIRRRQAGERLVRYQYQKVKCGWITWACGPFHSRTYGLCGFGTNKARAKAELYRHLNEDFGYIGPMLFSTIDFADKVGEIDPRLLDPRETARPITC